jgi:hypothetical protein
MTKRRALRARNDTVILFNCFDIRTLDHLNLFSASIFGFRIYLALSPRPFSPKEYVLITENREVKGMGYT